jgi:hypothetical protein
MQDLLRPVVEAYARELAKQPEVIAITEHVDAYQARTTGVKQLKERRPRGDAAASR